VAYEPEYPKPLLNLALAIALGLLVGVAGAITRDIADPTVRSSRDASEATGGLAVLGSIPRIRTIPRRPVSVGMPRVVVPAGPDRLIARSDPQPPRLRGVPGAAHLAAARGDGGDAAHGGGHQRARGRGEVTSAANLAVTLAQQGTRTLLVDADLRTGRLNALFGARPEPGFAEALLGRTPLSEACWRWRSTIRTCRCTSSPRRPAAQPRRALGSVRMQALVEEMRRPVRRGDL
jgi:tyrosine-protein kinase Etk/Wzc